MVILRVLLVLWLISLAVSFGVYLVSGDKRYLKFTWQLIKFTVVALAVIALVIAMGRIILF
ncbi:hypothetical protein SAMN05192560_0308 [Methylobacillus rhizosphaerae]|uniref:Uncharacterized protein n=1 Tax=Methylobacillus rhizosphaerae TaxID=551994 RepID=A0A238XYU7_9PROT|nr:hypothetical protein [Methylobacillus rhizosphaerae]SNR64067.1 hypothetical protein SAMN05192560_0308 [Methylobacillus rhizosphaerae]